MDAEKSKKLFIQYNRLVAVFKVKIYRRNPKNLRLSASNLGFLAEGVGFEPTSPFGETVFKTAAIDHSAIPPGRPQWDAD